ncbi:GNAT family N-acetyltransferase, partial [Bacillus mycoides]|nr:GNAT family N-acetyltransferase [Bacillus mycoides]
MEFRLFSSEDAEIYLKVCKEGLTKNPEAFSYSYEDVLKHENPVDAMAKRLSNPDKYTLGVLKDNDLVGIANLET